MKLYFLGWKTVNKQWVPCSREGLIAVHASGEIVCEPLLETSREAVEKQAEITLGDCWEVVEVDV